MAEYVDPKGGSFSESQGKKNPFLIAQSVSRTPLGMHGSPMKDFGIISGPIIAALAAAAKAAAATKVGAAVVGGVKALGAKLAATKVGGAVMKGVSAVAKGVKGVTGAIKGSKVGQAVSKVSKGIRKFTGKITGKKAVVGPKGPTGTEIKVPGAGKGPQFGSGASKSQISTISKPKGFTRPTTTVKGTGAEPATSTGAPKAPSTVSTTPKKSFVDRAMGKAEKIQSSKGYKAAMTAKSELEREDAEGEVVAGQASQRQAGLMASLPEFGTSGSRVPDTTSGEGEGEELGSVLSFKRSLRPKYAPLRLRAKNAISPFKGKKKYAEWQSRQQSKSATIKEMAEGSGFGVNPVTFQKDK